MDYKGIIDFNKYTLAVATGGLIYAFEKIPEFSVGFPTFVLLVLLVLFCVSMFLAVALFAAATRSLHLPDNRKGELDSTIQHLGTWHSGLLLAAVFILGTMMFVSTLINLGSESQSKLCCCQLVEQK